MALLLLRKLFIVGGLLLTIPLSAGLGNKTPALGSGSQRWISAGFAKVDAVTGAMEANIPLGPRLPGRIPLGINWHYTDTAVAINETNTGIVEPYKWPTLAALESTFRIQIWLNYQQVTLFLNPSPASDLIHSQISLRGADDGASDKGTNTLFQVASQRVSEDGGIQLVHSFWGSPGSKIGTGHRLTLFQGELNITIPLIQSTSGDLVFIDTKGTTKIKNRWGDWVTVTRTTDSNDDLTSLTMVSSLKHTLTLSKSGTTYTVTPSSDLNSTPVTMTMGAGFDIHPTNIHDGVQADTTLSWAPLVGHLLGFTLPSGATYTFSWEKKVPRPASEGFAQHGDKGDGSPDTASGILPGCWKGYEPVYAGSNSYLLGELYDAVTDIAVSSGTGDSGYSTHVDRTYPIATGYDSSKRQITWGALDNNVTITTTATDVVGARYSKLYLAQPVATGEYGAPAWPAASLPAQSANLQQQMLLFALGTVLAEESGTVEVGVSIVRSRTTLEGWSLNARMNPTGILVGDVPLYPTATRISRQRPQNDGPILIQDLSKWDNITFTQAVTGTIAPNATSPVIATPNCGMARWQGDSTILSTDATGAPVTRSITSHSIWDATWLILRPADSTTVMGGTEYKSLRSLPSGGSTTTIGARTFTFDDKLRLSMIEDDIGSFKSATQITPMDNAPEVSETSRIMSKAEIVDSGEAYTWNGPFRSGVRQKPDTHYTSESRDGAGRLNSVTSLDGVVTYFTVYDLLGRLKTSVRPALSDVASLTTTYDYSADGRTTTITATGGDNVRVVGQTITDAYGHPVSVVSQPDGNATHAAKGVFSVYDGFGQKTDETLALSKSTGSSADPHTHFTFDPDGFLSRVTNARGGVTKFERPAWSTLDGVSGFLTTVTTMKTDTLARNVTKTLTDLLGQTRRVQDSVGWTRMEYDAYGHLQTLTRTDPAGTKVQTRSFTVNEVGWLISQTQPEEGTTGYSRHTIDGTPLTRTTPGGTEIKTVLYSDGDNQGLPQSVSATTLGTTQIPSFTLCRSFPLYANRRPTAISETQPYGSVTETYGYNGMGILNQKTVSDTTGANPISFTISRTLDALGAVTSLTYPANSLGGSAVVTYKLDDYHRPRNVIRDTTTLATMTLNNIITDQGQELEQDVLTFANSASTAWTRNSSLDLFKVTHQVGGNTEENSTVVWSLDGLMVNRGVDTFDYDALSRLTSSTVAPPIGTTGPTVAQVFGYDVLGNRTFLTSSASAGQLPAEAVGYTLPYGSDNHIPNATLNGAPTGQAYDADGRLTSVYAVLGDPTTNTSWIYDPLGRVVHEWYAGVGTNFLLDGAGLRFKRIHSDGTARYVIYGFDREPLCEFDYDPGGPQSSLRGLDRFELPERKTDNGNLALNGVSL